MEWIAAHVLEVLGMAAAALAVLWRSPPVAALRRWSGKGRADEEHERTRAVVVEALGPLNTTVGECRAQLFPNSGHSLADRVAKIEHIMVARGDTLDLVVADQQSMKQSLNDLQRGQNTILERLFTHLPVNVQATGGD